MNVLKKAHYAMFNKNIALYGSTKSNLQSYETTPADVESNMRRFPAEKERIKNEDLFSLTWPEVSPELEQAMVGQPALRDLVRAKIG